MTPAARAGALYFLVVFAAGFLLGSLRVLAVAPALGATAAVLAELPVILAIAWIACRWLTRRCGVPATPGARLGMGGLAFALLMLAETVLGASLGRPLADQIRAIATLPGLIGLAGQIAFAVFPLLRLPLERSA